VCSPAAFNMWTLRFQEEGDFYVYFNGAPFNNDEPDVANPYNSNNKFESAHH